MNALLNTLCFLAIYVTSFPKTFITDDCESDDDCVSGCCAFNTGKCAGPVIAQERDGGCGFGDLFPNADSARAFGFTGSPGVVDYEVPGDDC